MSESFDDDGPWTHYKGSSNSSSSNNSTTGTDKVKSVRFGVLELAIFIGVWIVMLIAYKVYNRSSQKGRKGWFGPNEEKEAYEKALEDGEGNDEALKKLLVRRAMTDVRRLIQLQEDRDSVMSLSRAGALAEEMLVSFKTAEKELELELYEVQAEAETFREGWGAEIIQDAARLSKIEDELLAMKKRQEAPKERQEGTEERDTKTQPLDEQEKQRLLRELLEEEADDGGAGTTTGLKSRKRPQKHK